MAKPSPVSKFVVCSVCDLPWEDHTKGRKTAPTADVCIRLLRAEILKRKTSLTWNQQPNFFASGGTAGNVTSISVAQNAV